MCLFFFSAHPKCQAALDKAILETQLSVSTKKVKDMCRTRWIQRIDALHNFKSIHPSIVACMTDIYNQGSRMWSTDSVTDARSLMLAMTLSDSYNP